MNKKLLKDCCLLAGVIIIAAVGARLMAGGETLEEYAKEKASANSASSVFSSEETSTSIFSSEDVESIISTDNEASVEASSIKEFVTMEAAAEASTYNVVEDEPIPDDRFTLCDGFYYESIPQQISEEITGVSYVENDTISLDELRYCVLLFNDFDGEVQKGELICNEIIANDILEIFYELYSSGYQIESIKLIDEFNGDDTASMLANNTSCFNYRVVDNTTRLSKHAYGLAIDLNPFYNPYITYKKDGTVNISPEGSEAYADRSGTFPYKIDENDLAYKLFKAHGFKWGGAWNSVKDYQHFER